MSHYRFALRPWWIVSHLFVLALVVAMVSAGFWQLRRLDDRRERNDVVAARSVLAPVAVEGLVAPGDHDAVEELEYRRVTATGEYVTDREVLIRSRSLNGAPGSWVFTPLQLDDGTAVAVNRGWIPNAGELTAVPEEVGAPTGRVEVEGLVRRTEARGRFGAQDAADGVLTELARADVDRIDQQVDADLLPLYVQLLEQDPAVDPATGPQPVPVPPPDEGPHLSYAVQWFIFTTVAVVGYPLILRRRAREGPVEEPLDATDPEDGMAPSVGSGAQS